MLVVDGSFRLTKGSNDFGADASPRHQGEDPGLIYRDT